MTTAHNSKTSIKPKPTEDKTGIAGKLNRIHHDLNHISGGLVLGITKRRLHRQETLDWIKTLRRLADELETIVT